MGLGSNLNTDGIDQVGAMFQAYGATLSDSEGNIQVKSARRLQVSLLRNRSRREPYYQGSR